MKENLINSKGNAMLVVVVIGVLLVAGLVVYQLIGGNKNSVNLNPAIQAPDGQSEATVTITTSGFTPQTVHLKPGGRVIWKNEDSRIHALTGDPVLANIEPIEAGISINVSFDKAGTINYYDANNPSLKGQIIVE